MVPQTLSKVTTKHRAMCRPQQHRGWPPKKPNVQNSERNITQEQNVSVVSVISVSIRLLLVTPDGSVGLLLAYS